MLLSVRLSSRIHVFTYSRIRVFTYSRIHIIQIVDAKQEELIQKALKRKLKASDLVDMDEDGDGYSKHIHPTHPHRAE